MFLGNERGGVAVIAAFVLPVLGCLSAAVVELAEVKYTRVRLQSFVDAAALRAAREFAVDASSATVARARTQADGEANSVRPTWTIDTTARSDTGTRSVTVEQTAVRPSFFGSLLPPGGFKLEVSATASALASKIPLCLLGNSDAAGPSINLLKKTVLRGNGCLVQSNRDVQAADSSQIWAGAVRAVGSASGLISPAPTTDAPRMDDPFSGLAINVPTTCDDRNLKVNNSITINPGVHCGSITVGHGSRLMLAPGEHYFRDAQIDLMGKAELAGTDVVAIFSGNSTIDFKGQSFVTLEGRLSGSYAGFVVVTDRDFTGDLSISTDNARKILGTVYLPNASLKLDGKNNKVADQSAWTVIVAKNLQMDGGTEIVLNSNYFQSNVPLPSSISEGVRATLIR